MNDDNNGLWYGARIPSAAALGGLNAWTRPVAQSHDSNHDASLHLCEVPILSRRDMAKTSSTDVGKSPTYSFGISHIQANKYKRTKRVEQQAFT